VSKAFTDEEAADSPPIVAPRAPLPPNTPNYVTPRGFAALRAELAALQAERAALEAIAADAERAQALGALATRRAQIEQRIASAEVVTPDDVAGDGVRFGMRVTLGGGTGGERSYRIVGVDEADAAHGRIAFVSPLARALLGRAVGDAVRVRTPGGEEELEILAIDSSAEPA
jgi:transcription elongation factor GreB